LKHFSQSVDGKNLFVIDHNDPYRKGIQRRNSGDTIFWEENYSDSALFKDKKAIEKMFGIEIEPNYTTIMKGIEAENAALSFETKQKITQWIFYTKMRSPIWEPSSFTALQAGKSRYDQQLHLDNFTDENRFKAALDSFVQDTGCKRWTIYRSPKDSYWWTSDNPGYSIDLKMHKAGQAFKPDPYCKLSGVDSVLFYPLSKNYCLAISAYNYGEDVQLNLENTTVSFVQAEKDSFIWINFWTLITQARLVISADHDSLKPIEQIRLSGSTG
jgi:hypothetical protein